MKRSLFLCCLALVFCGFGVYSYFKSPESVFDKQLNQLYDAVLPQITFSAALIPVNQACLEMEAAGPDLDTDWDEFEIQLGHLEDAVKALNPINNAEADLVDRLNLYLGRMQTNVADARLKKLNWLDARDKSWYEVWKDPEAAQSEYQKSIQYLKNNLSAVKKALPAHGKSLSNFIGARLAALHDPDLDKETLSVALERFSGRLHESLAGAGRNQIDAGDEAIGQGISAIFGKKLTPAAFMMRFETKK